MPNKKKQKKLPLFSLLVAALIAVAVVGIFVFFKHRSNSTTASVPLGANQSTKGEQSSNDLTTTKQDGSSGNGSDKSSTTQLKLDCNFVSNHRPILSNKQSLLETSSCTTQPGTIVTIKFVNGSKTVSLPAKTADSSGSVVWDGWSVDGYNISEGAWVISATASNGQNTIAANDSTQLEVQP